MVFFFFHASVYVYGCMKKNTIKLHVCAFCRFLLHMDISSYKNVKIQTNAVVNGQLKILPTAIKGRKF